MTEAKKSSQLTMVGNRQKVSCFVAFSGQDLNTRETIFVPHSRGIKTFCTIDKEEVNPPGWRRFEIVFVAPILDIMRFSLKRVFCTLRKHCTVF